MRLDLHCHSTCSDGSFAPEEVARMAGEARVTLFCLTDHDTMAGYAATVAALPGVVVLRGFELSCRYLSKTVHLLLYDVQEGDAAVELDARLEQVYEERCQRLRKIIDRLTHLGYPLDEKSIMDDICEHGRTPGRPDIARALVRAGHCSSPREAFDRFLHDGGPADVSVARITLAEGLAMGRATGAKMSLAHPHILGRVELVEEVFRVHREQGLEGIEAHYGGYGGAARLPWLRMADELDLVVTGGSDFHGELSPRISRPGIEYPRDRWPRLSEWLGV